VEKSRLPQKFVDLAGAFMETYFERYDKPQAQNPADGNPLRKIFQEEVSLAEEELNLMLETEAEQIGLEWGQLLTRRVLKNSKSKPKKNFRSYLE